MMLHHCLYLLSMVLLHFLTAPSFFFFLILLLLWNLCHHKMKRGEINLLTSLSAARFCSISWTVPLLTPILLQTAKKWFFFPQSPYIFSYAQHCLLGGWIHSIALCYLLQWWFVVLLFWGFLPVHGIYQWSVSLHCIKFPTVLDTL